MTDNLLNGLAEGRPLGGPSFRTRMANEGYRSRVAAAGKLFMEAVRGDRRAMIELNESMSTSDFPILFGDFLSRTLAQRYTQTAPVWQQFAARTLVRDFRASKIIDLLGGGGLLDDVGELAPYPMRAFDESDFEIKVGKKGATLRYSWEMGINDDLGAFQRAPESLSRASRATEDHTVTSVLVDATGPKSWLGTAATDALSADNLEKGLQAITDKTDEDGNPIDVGTPILMVPQALKQTAQAIVNTTEVRSTSGTKTAIQSGNGLSATPKIVTNRWLTAIDQSATAKSTWYLLPDPNSARPAVYAAFLTGHEEPDLRVRNDQGRRVGGGDVPAEEGSFDNDAIDYRIRHVVGGATGFDDAVYVSKGA